MQYLIIKNVCWHLIVNSYLTIFGLKEWPLNNSPRYSSLLGSDSRNRCCCIPPTASTKSSRALQGGNYAKLSNKLSLNKITHQWNFVIVNRYGLIWYHTTLI